MRVLDLAPIAQLAREDGLALLVDATFASPINFRPLEHGADVVITSATKYLNGHSDVIAGAVAGTASLVEEVNRLHAPAGGQAIDPHAAWLVDRGLRTLAVRMERHNANGLAVAQLGREAPGDRAGALPRPGLPSRPRARQVGCSSGFGGMVGLELKGGARAAERMLKPPQAGRPRAEPGRRGEPRLRAAAHLAPEPRPRGARRGRAFRTASCG